MGGLITLTLPEIIMDVENHLFEEENGHPRGPLSTSMIVPGSVSREQVFWQHRNQ